MVAGELSGDQIGAKIIRILKKKYPNITIEGVAGPKMQAEGCVNLYPMEALSIIGIFEVIKRFFKIYKIYRGILKYIKKNKPDLYIGIDSPDFNFRIEKKIKKMKIKVIHCVSPSVWAWRPGRVKKIKKFIDTLFVLFPFEKKFYDNHLRAIFIGHHLANSIFNKNQTLKARTLFNIKKEDLVIALLPGSRKNELIRILPIFLSTIKILKEKKYIFSTFIPIASSGLYKLLKPYYKLLNQLDVRVIDKKAQLILQACDYALIASGTATLEAMLYKKPMVVGYKLSTLTSMIVRRMLLIKHFSLPNIIAEKSLVPEHIQENFTAESCAKSIEIYINNPNIVKDIKSEFGKINQSLVENSDIKILKEIMRLLN